MSVINQMLIELEKRGVARPSNQDTVRPVPVEEKHRYGWYVLAAGILLVTIAGWLYYRQSLEPGLSVAKTNVFIPPHIQSVSQVLVIAQASAPAVSEPVNPMKESSASAVPAQPALSEHLPSVQAVTEIRGTSAVAAASVVPEKAPALLSKKLKPETVQQQAENAFRRGNRLVQQGKIQEATEAYTEALRLDPGHVQAREALVATLIQNKRNTEAEKWLQETLQQNPAQPHFAMLLARLQVERNAVPAALDTLEKSQVYARQQPDYAAFVAALLQRQNRHQEAVTHYQVALQAEPDNGIWLMGLGISLQALSHNEEALAAYRKASGTQDLSPELRQFVKQRIDQIR